MCFTDGIKELFVGAKYFDLLLVVDDFTYFMAHAIFSMHYLKQSLILPKLMKEAKLEWLIKDASP